MSTQTKNADVIIIGGGIVGCAIAYKLAKEKLSVTVLERNKPGGEASGAAAGILAAQAEATGKTPYLDLCLQSRSLHALLAEEIQSETGIDVEFRSTGLLYLALTDAQIRESDERFRWQREAGLGVEKLSTGEAIKMEPCISAQAKSALYFPNEGQVNNVKLTYGLATAASKHGVQFLNGYETTRVIIEKERAVGVQTLLGNLSASWIVNAAGSWAATIYMGLSYSIPVLPMRGQILSFESGRLFLKRVLYSKDCYLVPRLNGRILVGSTMEAVGYDKSVTVAGMKRLSTAASEIAPTISVCSFKEAWAGLRPCIRDQMPVLGPTEVGGLLLATGHCRNGILLAPITADLISDLIIRGETSLPIDSFSSSRFRNS